MMKVLAKPAVVAGIDENVKIVRFNDFSDYESGLCNNGGHYGFWTDYTRLPDGRWERSFGTTADFQFCPCCGSFGNHYCQDDNGDYEFTCGNYDIVSEGELLTEIHQFQESDDRYIEYLEEGDDDAYI